MHFMWCQQLDRFFPAVKIMVFGVKQCGQYNTNSIDNCIQQATKFKHLIIVTVTCLWHLQSFTLEQRRKT